MASSEVSPLVSQSNVHCRSKRVRSYSSTVILSPNLKRRLQRLKVTPSEISNGSSVPARKYSNPRAPCAQCSQSSPVNVTSPTSCFGSDESTLNASQLREPCRQPDVPSHSLSFPVISAVSLTLENSGSVARDHLSVERTFLAYMRTSIAIAASGVGVCLHF